MACVALASLMSTIQFEFLQPIPRVPVHHDLASIKSLFENLSYLQACLEKGSRGGGGATIKDWEIKIRDFALKAEDDIEIQLRNFLLAKDREYREKASQELHQTLQEAADYVAELVNIIDSTSNEVDDDNETEPPIHWGKHAPESENGKSDGSSQRSSKLVDRMVGRRRDRRVIMERLTSDFSDLTQISIVGMVGIGKTTLAESVYRDPKVEQHFDVRGWITMPQEYNKSHILRFLLRSISPAAENQIEKGTAPEELEEQVRNHLFGKRYLIVLDNLDRRAVKDISMCFPDNENGSRILHNTTHYSKYDYYREDYTHNMTLLDQNESWNLFCNTLSLKEYMAPEYEQIKSHVLEVCDGLPLTIVTVGKRLSKCNNNNILKEWEKIKKEIESLGILDRNALALNYNQLSQNLKVCFLYLGVFPKRKEILVKKLIGLWIAEGFFMPLEREELENQCYKYLKELIDRSFVLVCNRSSKGKIKSCRMHSALHSFCVGEAQKQGIFCAANTLQHSRLPLSEFANSCRWLSLYTHSFDYYVLFSTHKPRSIFFFDDDPETFVPFKLLRVLAFVPYPFLQRVSMHLGDLVFLRYLSLSQRFEGLGNIMSLIPNLQTLIVSSDKPEIEAPTIHLPSRIWELPQLRHLELGDMYTIDPPCMVEVKLQALSWVSPTHCGMEVFPNLRKLKIFYKDNLEPSHTHGSSSNPIILDNFGYLKRLQRLTVSVSIGCTVIHTERFMCPLQLKKLRLSRTNLSQRDLTVIGMLPELMVLKLENAFRGRVWEVAKGGFHKLRFLLLEDKNLKQLMFDKYSFKSLKRLVLKFCDCLEEIPNLYYLEENPNKLDRCNPSGAFVRHPLKSIELDRCNFSVVASAKLIQKMKQRGRFELIIDGVEHDEPQSYTHVKESVEEGLTEVTVKKLILIERHV